MFFLNWYRIPGRAVTVFLEINDRINVSPNIPNVTGTNIIWEKLKKSLFVCLVIELSGKYNQK